MAEATKLEALKDADLRRKLEMAMKLRIDAKVHEAQAKTKKDEADLIAKELFERYGLSSVENEQGYKLNYISKLGTKLDQKKLTESLVLAGVDAQIVADCMIEATTQYPMQYLELRAPKD